MKRCIINYAEGGWYPRGQARLLQSLASVGWKESVFLFNATSHPDCPSHYDIPYGFKYWAFDCVREMGYDQALWLDCSFYAAKPLDGIFDGITDAGYVLQRSEGYTVGDWTSDVAIEKLGLSRLEAKAMVMHDGGLIGLDFRNDKATLFLDEMLHCMTIDGMFQGAWTNEKHQVSDDDTVGGHRHDMSVGSVVASTLKMQYAPAGTYWCEKKLCGKYPNACIVGEGM